MAHLERWNWAKSKHNGQSRLFCRGLTIIKSLKYRQEIQGQTPFRRWVWSLAFTGRSRTQIAQPPSRVKRPSVNVFELLVLYTLPVWPYIYSTDGASPVLTLISIKRTWKFSFSQNSKKADTSTILRISFKLKLPFRFQNWLAEWRICVLPFSFAYSSINFR